MHLMCKICISEFNICILDPKQLENKLDKFSGLNPLVQTCTHVHKGKSTPPQKSRNMRSHSLKILSSCLQVVAHSCHNLQSVFRCTMMYIDRFI